MTFIGDTLFDNMCPDQAFDTPWRAFRLHMGQHFTFPGLYITDMQDLIRRMRESARRLTTLAGAPVMGDVPIVPAGPGDTDDYFRIVLTHPWDTGVQFEMVEIQPVFARSTFVEVDPRHDVGWMPADPPPETVGAEQASHHTLVVEDEAACLSFLVDACGASVIH
jgi:hypothetical protein